MIGQPDSAGQPPVHQLAFADQLLDGFSTNLFVQANCTETQAVAELVERAAVGVVYTMGHQQRQWSFAGGAVEHTRRRTGTTNLLVDRNLYSGSKRRPAADGLCRDWVDFQRSRLKLRWALTDSGYCPAGDTGSVRTLLDASQALGDHVIVVLPVAHQLLRDDPETLYDLIHGQGNPVAFVVEDEYDPFDKKGVVDGLVRVLAGPTEVGLLRADTSAMGAIAHRGAFGAVGTHSPLRHLYPDRGGGGHEENLAFVIPRLLGYYRNDRFLQAHMHCPTLITWTCECPFCGGAELTRIGESTDAFDAAFQHSVASIGQLGAQLMQLSERMLPAGAWSHLCGVAQAEHDRVATPEGSQWEPKVALRRWRDVAAQPAVS